MVLRQQAVSPTGQGNARILRSTGFDGGSDGTAVNVGHAEISEDHSEGLTPLVCSAKCIDASLTAIGRLNGVSILFENGKQRLQDDGIVVYDEDAQRPLRVGHGRNRAAPAGKNRCRPQDQSAGGYST